MTNLQKEINRWLEVLETKGYFRELEPKERQQVKDAFSTSIHEIYEKSQHIDTEKEEFGMGFQLIGKAGDLKWNTQILVTLNTKTQQIELAGSEISLKNPKNGLSFDVSSNKSLLDLESIIAIGHILPAKIDFYQIPRHERRFDDHKRKGQGPSLN